LAKGVYGEIKRLEELVSPSIVGGLPLETRSIKVVKNPSAEMCLACRAAKLLCGRPRCPILVRATQYAKGARQYQSEIVSGASPPGVFVGRWGYPRVSLGPLVAPSNFNAEILDRPESWLNKSIDEIVGYRYNLLRGKETLRVDAAVDPSKSLLSIHELVLSASSVCTELVLTQRPSMTMSFSDDVEPLGPSATYSRLSVKPSHSDRRLEKVYYDFDLKASDAATALYRSGVEVSKIQKAFSVGIMGQRRTRRIVPTRWSITAVDSVISQGLIERVKLNPSVNETRVYTFNHMESTYVGFVFPAPWGYEWVEGWQPNTVWNVAGHSVELIADNEGTHGRTTYAEPGGCYYAARLASAESLEREGRKGAVVLLREIHPGYIIPLGVWTVREAIRELFRQPYTKFATVREAVNYGVSFTTIPLGVWLKKARLLAEKIGQRKITDFLS
jgi:hypothetical protein